MLHVPRLVLVSSLVLAIKDTVEMENHVKRSILVVLFLLHATSMRPVNNKDQADLHVLVIWVIHYQTTDVIVSNKTRVMLALVTNGRHVQRQALVSIYVHVMLVILVMESYVMKLMTVLVHHVISTLHVKKLDLVHMYVLVKQDIKVQERHATPLISVLRALVTPMRHALQLDLEHILVHVIRVILGLVTHVKRRMRVSTSHVTRTLSAITLVLERITVSV